MRVFMVSLSEKSGSLMSPVSTKFAVIFPFLFLSRDNAAERGMPRIVADGEVSSRSLNESEPGA